MSGPFPSLAVRSLSKQFRDRGGTPRTVLDGISVDIAQGEFICIVGASGSGKTTFLRAVGGLIEPDGGTVLVDGQPGRLAASRRAFVFQNDSLFPWRTVIDNVVFGLEVQRRPRVERNAVGASLLELVGLADHADRYPGELSGGMRQRVNLARALAVDPDVLLMDEPFAALDAQTRELMQRELLGIWARRRKTVIFITHQIDEAVYLADRVLVFSSHPGRLHADIPVRFPRPRELGIKHTAEFAAHVRRIWTMIERDVAGSHAPAKN